MHNIKDAFKMIWSKKVISVLLIIQLFVSFFAMIEWIVIKNNSSEAESAIANRIDVNDLYINIKTVPTSIKEAEKTGVKSKKLQNYIDNHKEIDTTGEYYSSQCNIKEDNRMIDYDLLDKKLNSFYNGKYSDVRLYFEGITINKKSYDFFNIPVEHGEKIKEEDFSKKPEEVKGILLGAGFKEFYSLGDKVTFGENDNFVVRGFLPKGYKFLGDSHNTVTSLRDTDMMVVYPINMEEKSDNAIKYEEFTNTVIKVKDKKNTEKVIKDINDRGKEYGLDLDCKEIYKVTGESAKELDDNIRHLLVLSIIIVVFASISSIITIINYIIRRKREFGIRMASGGSIKKIIELVVTENLIIYIIAGVLSVLAYYKKYAFKGSHINELSIAPSFSHLGVREATYFFIFVLVVSMVTCIVPVLKLRKMEPKDLIGGME